MFQAVQRTANLSCMSAMACAWSSVSNNIQYVTHFTKTNSCQFGIKQSFSFYLFLCHQPESSLDRCQYLSGCFALLYKNIYNHSLFTELWYSLTHSLLTHFRMLFREYSKMWVKYTFNKETIQNDKHYSKLTSSI